MLRLILISVLTASGCYLPTHYHDPVHSQTRGEIRPEDIGFIIPNKTGIEELLLTIGEPDYTSPDGRILAYEWNLVEAIVVIVDSARPVMSENYLLVFLNKDNTIKKTERISFRWGHKRYAFLNELLGGYQDP